MSQNKKQRSFVITHSNIQQSILDQSAFIFKTLADLGYTSRDIATFSGLRISEVNETKKAKTPMFMRAMCFAHSLGVEPTFIIERHNGEVEEGCLSLETPYPLAEGKVFLADALRIFFVECLFLVMKDDNKTDLDIERLTGVSRYCYSNVVNSINGDETTNSFRTFSCDLVLKILTAKTKKLTIEYDLTQSRPIIRKKGHIHPITYTVFK